MRSHEETQPDVVFRGHQIWKKGSGLETCLLAIQYAKSLGTQCIIDPFCGKGSVLAVANYLGLNSFGVEIKANLANDAMALVVKNESEALKKMKHKFGWKKEKDNEET